MEFLPDRSFAYRFSRYELLPEIQRLPETQSGEPFLLREIAWPIIDSHLTQDQQSIRLKKTRSDGDESMGQLIRFYLPYLAKDLNIFESLGKGYFRAQVDVEVSESDLKDAEIDEGVAIADEFEGHIYAFTFPSIVKDGVFPIKVGKTTGDVELRVADQCKGSATFEPPKVLATWPVKRVGPTELAIHNILKARGKHREEALGREWFNTTVAEVAAIVEFIGG